MLRVQKTWILPSQKTKTESDEEEKTTSDAPNNEESSPDQVATAEKEEESESVATDHETKVKIQTGSNLPNGNPAANVEVITGDSVCFFYERIEYFCPRYR